MQRKNKIKFSRKYQNLKLVSYYHNSYWNYCNTLRLYSYTLRSKWVSIKKNLQKTKRYIISSFWRDRDKPDRSGAIFSEDRRKLQTTRGARMFVSTTTECEHHPRVDKRKQIDVQWGDDALIANSFGNRPLDVESSIGFCTAGGHNQMKKGKRENTVDSEISRRVSLLTRLREA